MCALLVSAITLTGATNRSFRTEVEQWNPIGFTQAQSGPETTNRLTASSAILPNLTTSAPSGELRGFTSEITFTTDKRVGEKVFLQILYTGSLSLNGLSGTPQSGKKVTYILTSPKVTITGNVVGFDCSGNQITSLEVSKNSGLMILACHGNRIKGENMTRLVNSLPDRTSKSAGTFIAVRNVMENNVCLASDVAIAKSKYWNTKMTNLKGTETGDYKGSHVISFTTAKAVGETVEIYMKYTGAAPELSGMTGTPASGTEVTYTLTAQTVTITGDVTHFKCSENQLTALDVSTNTALDTLKCSNNKLTALDLSQNTALKTLYCSGNQLSALDVSKNTKLVLLSIENNQLTALDLSHNTALKELYCYYNQLTELDLSHNTALGTLNCSNNQLTALDLSQNTALKGLYCYINQLPVLDLSHNTALESLQCYNNQLTALDLSKNTALETLFCYENKLTALDLSHNTALETLECYKNQLTGLDVSQNTALETLYCYENKLTALDVSNTVLSLLLCYGNQIKGEEMTRLVNSLPDRTDEITGSFIVVQAPAPEGNVCFKSDVAIAKGKHWNTEKINSDSRETSDYEGKTNVITFKTDKAVGETIVLSMEYTGDAPTLTGLTGTPVSGTEVTYALTAQEVTITGDVTQFKCSNNKLTALDCSQNSVLTWLDCSNNQLTALGVSKNSSLTLLSCSNNKLTALDFSPNSVLTLLDCSNNQLTALGVSKNSALTMLVCSNNQLTALDLSQNTALKTLYCYNNQLTALNVSKNTALGTLKCYSNQLTALDLSQNTALTKLECSYNQLATLDLSHNTALEALYCCCNQLTALDVSNTALRWLDCSNNQLTALDLSKNTALRFLRCYGNQIKGEKMTQLMNSLPDWTSKSAGTIDVVQEPAPEGNRCLKTDVAIAKGKNWIVQKYNTEHYLPFAYEGEEPIPYAVTLAKEGEGTLNATGADDLKAVPEGTELTIEATPADGYELKALTANGTDILATKKFTVTADTEVKAIFAKTYAVTLTKEGEGTLTATGADDLKAVPEGTELTVVATPAAGYELTALTANGTDILATKKVVVKGATEVKATFTKKTYAVTLAKEGEGTLTATGADDLKAVPEGTELTIEATPAAGYELKALTANGTDILATKKVVVKGATEVKATFTKKTAADVVESSAVRLYPNPAGTYVNVKAAKADALVRLYNANGTLLYEARTDANGTLQIDLSAYAEGTYLLRVGSDAQRLLIQR